MQHVLVQIIILSLFLLTRLKPEVLNNNTGKSIKNLILSLGKVCMLEKHFLKTVGNSINILCRVDLTNPYFPGQYIKGFSCCRDNRGRPH